MYCVTSVRATPFEVPVEAIRNVPAAAPLDSIIELIGLLVLQLE